MKTVTIPESEFNELKDGVQTLIEKIQFQESKIEQLEQIKINLTQEVNELKNTEKQESIRNLLDKIQSSKRIYND